MKGEETNMNRNTVIEIAYKTIKDNVEWGAECENKTFGYFIEGIVSMTDALLEKFNEGGRPCEDDD